MTLKEFWHRLGSPRWFYGISGPLVWVLGSLAVLLLVVGTSATVYPAASLVPLASRAGARVIEVNIERTPFSELADASLQGPSGEILNWLIS